MVYVKWRILENGGIPRVKCRYTTCKSNQTGYQTNTKVSANPKPNRLSQRAVLTRSLKDYYKGSSDPKHYCSLRSILGVSGNFRERPVFSHIRIVNVASSGLGA
jgi:hypothetical protein